MRYYNRTVIRAYKELVKNKKATYTVVGAGVPPHRIDLKPIWKECLRSALRIFKRRYNIDYILLFEVSPKGYDHAHIVLTKKIEEDQYQRLYANDVNDLRNIYFRILIRKLGLEVAPRNLKFFDWKECAEKLRLDNPDRMMKFVNVYKFGDRYISGGKTPAFLNYLLIKPELLNSKTSVLSSGFIEMRKIC